MRATSAGPSRAEIADARLAERNMRAVAAEELSTHLTTRNDSLETHVANLHTTRTWSLGWHEMEYTTDHRLPTYAVRDRGPRAQNEFDSVSHKRRRRTNRHSCGRCVVRNTSAGICVVRSGVLLIFGR